MKFSCRRCPRRTVTGLAGDMDSIHSVLSEEQREHLRDPVYIEVPRGHAAFHHPLMVHGSSHNQSNRPRRATVINAIRNGVASDTDEPLLQGIPVIPKGHKMDGPFFPLLRD